jgi:hypothetical protein
MEQDLLNKWYSRQQVQDFLGFGNTKMCQLHKDFDIRTVKIGRKVFYSIEDLENLFKKSIENQ